MGSASKRRWFQFGLGPMFLLIGALAVWSSLERNLVRDRQELRIWLEDRSCMFVETSEQNPLTNSFDVVNNAPIWRRWIGDKSIAKIQIRSRIADTKVEKA